MPTWLSLVRTQSLAPFEGIMNPKFIIFTGPMFGSKTTRLFAALDRYKYQKRKIIAFKPGIDDRYCAAKITTHSGASMPARVVNAGMEIL